MAKNRNPKGLGHYYKKDGLFCWKYVRDGKPLYRSSATEKGLQTKVRKVIGLAVTNDKTKVSEYFNTFLNEYVKAMSKPATYNQYNFIYKKHIEPEIGDFKMTSITTTDIQKVILEMNKKNLSTKTMKHAKTVMSVAFTRAYKIDKIIPENPVKDIQIPNKQAKPRKTLTIEELSKFYKSLENSRWIWSVKFAVVTGIRRGELLSLKWSDIDWKNNRIKIDKSNSSTGLGDTKSAKIHYVPLSELAKSYLLHQMDKLKQEENPVTFKDDNTRIEDLKETEFLVFPTEMGTMIKPNTYYHTIVRYAKKTAIKVHPHCFRHTFVYNMRNKLSLKELQDILGHDESTTTLDIYGDMINDTTDAKAKTIDSVFASVEAELEKVRVNIENKECKIISLSDRRKAK
jgi:integrase